MSAVEKFQNLIAEQAPKLAAIPRSCRQLDPAISGAACGTNDIGSSHARQPSIMEPVVLRKGPLRKSKATVEVWRGGKGQLAELGRSSIQNRLLETGH